MSDLQLKRDLFTLRYIFHQSYDFWINTYCLETTLHPQNFNLFNISVNFDILKNVIDRDLAHLKLFGERYIYGSKDIPV